MTTALAFLRECETFQSRRRDLVKAPRVPPCFGGRGGGIEEGGEYDTCILDGFSRMFLM